MNRPISRKVKPAEPVKMNTYRKDLSWPHFDDEPSVQEKQRVKDRQSCISVFVAYLIFQVATKSTSPDVATAFHALPYGRFIAIQRILRMQKLCRTNQGSNFLGSSFSNRNNLRVPIQLRIESQPMHVKRLFLFKNRPIHFHLNRTSDRSNETS